MNTTAQNRGRQQLRELVFYVALKSFARFIVALASFIFHKI